MDIFHYFLLAVAAVFFILFLREKRLKKSALLHHQVVNDRVHEIQSAREVFAKELLLLVLPAEKISYRPAEDRFALNFVYPPPAPEMLVVSDIDECERKIMDVVDKFLGGKLRAGRNFSWIQIPGSVTEEERARYSNR